MAGAAAALTMLCAPAEAAPAHEIGGSGSASDGAAKVPDGSVSPAGANDWSCPPTAAHPRPVVLVHGTWGNQNDWNVLAPQLKAEGYCVFSLNFGRDTGSVMGAKPGVYGTGDIRASAGELAAFTERVRDATGSAKVDLVAHSQGALVARQYLRFEGGAAEVGSLVSLAGTNHGTTMNGLASLLPPGGSSGPAADLAATYVGTAAVQQLVGSDVVRTINAGGDTEPGIAYTVVATRLDKASTPPEATFLQAGPGATVDNIWVHDVCPTDTFDHGPLPQSPTIAYLVQRALDPAHTGISCPQH
ncbi:esterase/lipase family protein [Nocardia sp. NPDC052566]|uniref:esterase/lipase family protein n=1 Tax=Nocardia sp. NPDC052566 TaxID=3364330 RepID=UPI0037CBCE26